MLQTRELVTAALAERAKKGVKVRQPLAKLTLGKGQKISDELRDLLAEEVNVKKVDFNPALTTVQIDWEITPELKEEGLVREIMRNIQELRKNAKYTPEDKIIIYAEAAGQIKETIANNQEIIIRETKASKIEFKKTSLTAEVQTTVDKQPLWLGIKKC
jgi:isoleucyl-tRNA synthetase